VPGRIRSDHRAQRRPGRPRAFWSHSANLRFAAPAGTAITKLIVWRWGQMVKTDAGVNDWRVYGETDEGRIPLEGCLQGDAYECQFGALEPAGSLSNASRAEYAVNTTYLNWGVACDPPEFRSCPTARQTDPYPLASMIVYGFVVTITDPQVPTLKPAGPLLTAGWRRPSDVLTYDASDATGIRSVRLEIGGRTARTTRACDYRRPAPCSNVTGGRLTVPAGVPDGPLAARIVAEDAAGNPAVVQRTINIDGTPPTAVLERASGKMIIVAVTDQASGVASAGIEVRKNSKEPYRPLTATVENGRLTAKLDRGRASRVDMRVTVRDVVGNVTQGNPTRLSATSARIGRRLRKVRSGRVKVPFGRTARLRGRLTLSARQSFAGPDHHCDGHSSAPGRASTAGRQRGDRPSRTLLHPRAARSEPHVPPRVQRRGRGTRHRAPRFGAGAGVEHDPRLADPRVRPDTGALQGAHAHPRRAAPGTRARARPAGPREGALAHVRGHPDEPHGPLARELHLQRAPGALPDPGPHPAPVDLPVRARLLAGADCARGLKQT
jgi:hypothetical protein